MTMTMTMTMTNINNTESMIIVYNGKQYDINNDGYKLGPKNIKRTDFDWYELGCEPVIDSMESIDPALYIPKDLGCGMVLNTYTTSQFLS